MAAMTSPAAFVIGLTIPILCARSLRLLTLLEEGSLIVVSEYVGAITIVSPLKTLSNSVGCCSEIIFTELICSLFIELMLMLFLLIMK